jgi:hypothetical protein
MSATSRCSSSTGDSHVQDHHNRCDCRRHWRNGTYLDIRVCREGGAVNSFVGTPSHPWHHPNEHHHWRSAGLVRQQCAEQVKRIADPPATAATAATLPVICVSPPLSTSTLCGSAHGGAASLKRRASAAANSQKQWSAAQPSPASGDCFRGKLPSSRTSFFVAEWPTRLATLAGREGRYRSKFRRDDYEARRLKVATTKSRKARTFAGGRWREG